MAHQNSDAFLTDSQDQDTGPGTQTIQANASSIELPDDTYIRDADIQRHGTDLTLDSPHGTITIEGYFSAEETPTLTTPNGLSLTPDLVRSFVTSPAQYAQNMSMNDESPIGEVREITGEATITHTDGSIEPVSLGTEIYQGDIIETGSGGAVNITFSDQSSFAVSEDARMAIDEYVFDPSTEEGTQNFSVLKGLFVFTSGLVGRDDPDDVRIETPGGSIGIRGTIIAGDVDHGEITVIEGAIVLRDFSGNEITLDEQFETGKFLPQNGGLENMGQLSAQNVSQKFLSVSKVSPTLFSSVNDSAAETGNDQGTQPVTDQTTEAPESADANGSIDQNADNLVDGTVETDNTGTEDGTESTDGTSDSTDGTASETENPIEEQKLQENPDATETETAPTDTMTSEPIDLIMRPISQTTNTIETVSASGSVETLSGDTTTDPLLTNSTQTTTTTAPPPPPPSDTTTPPPPPPPPTGTNSAPVHIRSLIMNNSATYGQVQSIAPPAFFKVGEGQTWDYYFDKEFFDVDGNIIDYKLSAATIANLDSVLGTGQWNFNNSNGHLMLNAPGSVAGTLSLDLDIRALDSAGATSGFKTYNFAFEGNSGTNAAALSSGADGGTLSLLGSGTSITLNSVADNNRVFLDDAGDTVTIMNGKGNYINLGDGNNTATITNNTNNTNNVIVGGFQQDTFIINNAKNNIYGMDGDDKFMLDPSTLNLSSAGYRLDGGHSGFRAGNALKSLGLNYNYGDSSGFGDTLIVQGSSPTLDFSTIPQDYFRGMERIDMTTSNVTISNLSYNAIINMTDYKNTLILRGDANDQVNFNGLNAGNTQKVLDNVSIQEPGSNQMFDVYEIQGGQGTVTLLVEQNSGTEAFTTTGLP